MLVGGKEEKKRIEVRAQFRGSKKKERHPATSTNISPIKLMTTYKSIDEKMRGEIDLLLNKMIDVTQSKVNIASLCANRDYYDREECVLDLIDEPMIKLKKAMVDMTMQCVALHDLERLERLKRRREKKENADSTEPPTKRQKLY